MAEIQDTSGAKPQLRRYQSRGVQVKDAPVNKGGSVEESDAKMWDSISGSLETVINVGNKMRRLALEDEKVKISADMQSHYIDATSALSTGMNEQTNEQLTGFENLYGSKKLTGSYEGLKEYVVPDGYSKKAQEEMTPFIKLAEKKFQADALKLHFGELVQRSNNQLSLLEDKSLSGLSLQLEEYESAKDTVGTFESNGKKVQKMFAFATGKGIDNQKAQAANNLLSVYVQNVLEGKVERGLMSQGAMDLRVYNYAQKLGAVQFEHYQGIDEDKAFDLAVKKGIVLDPGGGRDKIIYNDPKLGTYINQARIRERSELETNKRNIHLREQKLLYEGKGAKFWLEGIGRAFDPDAIRVGEPTSKIKWTPQEIRGESIAGTIEQVVTQSKRKYTAKEQEARMNTMAEVIFKKLGKESGFTSAEHVKSAYMGMVLEAKGEKEKYIKFKRAEDDRRTADYLGYLRGHFANVRGHQNKEKRFQIISDSHKVDPKTDTWVAKESYIQRLVKSGQVNEAKARSFMLTVTPGISTRSPGAGLDDTGMKNLQNALASYYQNELFVKNKNSMGKATSYNPDPMEPTAGATDEYNLYQLNHEQRTMLANQRNEYEEIIDFDNDRFVFKSTKALTDGWREIQERQGSTTAKRSRAMSVIGDNYANSILIPRITALATDPNGTIMKDLKIDFKPEEGLDEDKKDLITKRWNDIGEDRSRFYSHTEPPNLTTGEPGKKVWIFFDKNTLQGMATPFLLSPTFLDLKSKAKPLTAKEQLSQ